MSFNIIAESAEKLDFNEIHKALFIPDSDIELFPMPFLGIKGGDALGISIPIKSISEQVWHQLSPILESLRVNFRCNVYDLYGGQMLDSSNLNSFKRDFFL